MFFNKFFGGNTTTTNENKDEVLNNNGDNNEGGVSRFSFGLNKISMSSDTFKKLGSSVQSFASNVYQKIEEETKKLVEEGPNTYSDCTMMPPWNDFQLEDKEKQREAREKILELKMSRSTFLQSPPLEADYFQEFDDYLVKIATVSLKYDPILQKIRFHFVPKLISEEQFWKNWFYKVSVVKKQYNIVTSTNDTFGKENENEKDNNIDVGSGSETDSGTTKNEQQPQSPPQEETEIGKWEKELQSELDSFNIGQDGEIDFSLNNDLLNDDDDNDNDNDDDDDDDNGRIDINADNDDDDDDWESKIGLELQQQSQANTTFSSPIISTYSTPITDSDVDLEIERELQRMSQSSIVDKSTTEELIEEIESEIQLAQKDGLVLSDTEANINNNNNSNDYDNDNDDINNCSNIEINNSSIEINNDYDNTIDTNTNDNTNHLLLEKGNNHKNKDCDDDIVV